MWPEITHVLRDTLHDHRRALGWWALGLTLYTLSVLAVYPAFKDDPSLNEVMRSLPDALKVLFGEDYTSPAGYVGGKLLSMMPVLLSLYAGLTGAGLIAGAERRGHLEFPLSTPLSRTGLLAGRTLALLVLLLALGFTLFAVTWVGGALFHAPLNAAHLLTTVTLHTLGAWVFGALALAAGAATGQPGLASGLGVGLGIFSMVLYGLGAQVPALSAVEGLNPWKYALALNALKEQVSLVPAVVSLLVGVLLVAAALPVFLARDVGR